ncbi:porin [Aliiroseovarius marinus]|uniref:porin n=1 Tax=Aliiroseovarius marinus TaxID=2500159 RepID=UPI003D7DABF4
MKYQGIFAAIALSVVTAPAAQALDVGGELTIGYSSYKDHGDLGAKMLDASVELGFDSAFSVQMDLSGWRQNFVETDTLFGFDLIDEIDQKVGSAALHLIYDLSPDTSVGGFIGREVGQITSTLSVPELGLSRTDSEELLFTYYGAEIAHDFGAVSVEVAASFVNEDFGTGHVIDLGASYAINDRFSVGVNYIHGRSELVDYEGETDAWRIEARYRPTEALSIYGNLGHASIGTNFNDGTSVVVNEPVYGFGLTYAFGASKGTTFGSRSMLRHQQGL